VGPASSTKGIHTTASGAEERLARAAGKSEQRKKELGAGSARHN